MSGQFSLPVPESSRWVIESAGPRDEIFHASGRQQRALRFQATHSDIFRVGDHALLSKRQSLGSDGLQTDWADSCHCCESAAALLLAFGFVEIRDAFFGYYMADVVTVDHDRRYWHSGLFANLHRVESFNERRNATFLKGLYGLHHELSTANDRFRLVNQVKPRW